MNSDKNEKQAWKADKYIQTFQGVLELYEKEHPHWQIEVLFSFIKRGLLGLKRQIEDRDRTNVTWDQPFTSFHYPVEWDWNIKDVVMGKPISGIFTEENTRDAETAQKTITEMMVNHLNALALQDFTNHVWIEKRGDSRLVFLPSWLNDQLQEAKSKNQRQQLLKEFAHPFSIGAALIDYGADDLRDGQRISKLAAKQLANIDKLIAIKRLGISANISGRDIEMWLVFQIHALTIDCEKKRAYHSITVGLVMPPKVVGSDVLTTTLSDWPQTDIEIFWKKLFQEIDKAIDDLIPKAESRTSVLLQIDATVEILLASSNFEGQNAAQKRILDALSQTGLVRGFSMKEAVSSTAWKSTGSQAVEEKAPVTPTEGVMRLIWNSRWRWLLIILLSLAGVAVLVYGVLPDEAKVRFLKLFGYHSLH